MFTGIVEEVARVEAVRSGGLTIAASKVTDDLAEGGSINVNGVCLTVTSGNGATFTVDIVPETLRRTNLGRLDVGSPVNLERPVAAAGRLDGHIVQGHVDGTGVVASLEEDGSAILVRIDAGADILRYMVEKGFVAVDGASLTVVNCDSSGFVFTVIPYTKENTVLGTRTVGDAVNLEVDMIAKYLEKLLSRA